MTASYPLIPGDAVTINKPRTRWHGCRAQVLAVDTSHHPVTQITAEITSTPKPEDLEHIGRRIRREAHWFDRVIPVPPSATAPVPFFKPGDHAMVNDPNHMHDGHDVLIVDGAPPHVTASGVAIRWKVSCLSHPVDSALFSITESLLAPAPIEPSTRHTTHLTLAVVLTLPAEDWPADLDLTDPTETLDFLFEHTAQLNITTSKD